MSSYTITLDEVLRRGHSLGMQPSDYPIFDEGHRATLNKRIIDHYRFREIGSETVEMFVFQLNRRLREVMPYYNKLYESTLIQFNPMVTSDITETVHQSSTGQRSETQNATSDSTNVTDSVSRAVNSEMPQTMLAGNQDYASSAADSKASTTASAHNTGTTGTTASDTGTGEVTRHMVGQGGSGATLLMAYRETIVNVDLMIVLELENLFMQLWETGDTYTETEYQTPTIPYPGGMTLW